MNRFHVHVSVRDLERSVAFYSAMFGRAPQKRREGYARWLLDDPRLNFAISASEGRGGVDHLGMQVDSVAELDQLTGALRSAGESVEDERNATCCYAKSDKGWVRDPQGLSWETFVTHADATAYGQDGPHAAARAGCCAG